MRPSVRFLLAFAVVAAVAAPLNAQDIDTRVGADLTGWYDLGMPWSSFGAHYVTNMGWGQTFTASDAYLNSFSFWLTGPTTGPNSSNGALSFRAILAEWNDGVLGPQIWQSALRTRSGGSYDELTEYAFDVGAALDPGRVYAAFLAPAPSFDFETGTGGFATGFVWHSASCGYQCETDTYAGGEMFAFNSDLIDMHQGYTPWRSVGVAAAGRIDAAFTADFSPTVVPEPLTMVLLGSGLVGVAGAARRRREQAAPEE